MINELKIKNYKCFDEDIIKFKNLTLLTGTNSSGKSSLIQSLLYSGLYSSQSDMISFLNSLGSFKDLRNRNIKKDLIEIIAITSSGSSTFTLNNSDEMKSELNTCLSYPRNLTYLNANRLPISEVNSITNIKERSFGINGEYSISYYEQNKSSVIDIVFDPLTKSTLSGQIDYWLKIIFSIELDFATTKISTTHTQAYYNVDNIPHKPENLGAGISYLLSILIACLSAKKDNIIIVDNPEIHLHPKAQSRLLDFFSFISKKGIQVILESHSDHIFNAIKKNVYLFHNSTIKEEFYLNQEDVIVHFFDNKKRSEILISNMGQVENHHEGLFDQFEDDLNVLLGL